MLDIRYRIDRMKGLYVLIALHVAAALKHQFINRDNVLHRMIPLIPRRP